MSAVLALQAPLIAALKADAALAGKLSGDKVYSMSVPAGAQHVPPYIVLGTSSEQESAFLGGEGSLNQETGHIYSNEPDKVKVLSIFADVARVLDNALGVPGFSELYWTCDLLAVITDPPTGNAHGIFVLDRQHAA